MMFLQGAIASATSENEFMAFGDALEMFMIGFLVLMAVGLLLTLIMYIFYGLGMSRIAENEGYSKPWLAWVPIANLFMIPLNVESDVHGWMRGRFTKLFAVVYIVTVILGAVVPNILATLDTGLGLALYVPLWLIMLVPSLMLAYGFYFIVARYSEQRALHMVIMVITLGYSVPFQLFRFRNRESLVLN